MGCQATKKSHHVKKKGPRFPAKGTDKLKRKKK